MALYNFLVRRDANIVHSEIGFHASNMGTVWEHIHRLANTFDSHGTHVRVTDDQGDVVIAVGVLTAQIMNRAEAA